MVKSSTTTRWRIPQRCQSAQPAGTHDHPRRVLQDPCHDRLAPGLWRHAGGCRAGRQPPGHQFGIVHGHCHADCGVKALTALQDDNEVQRAGRTTCWPMPVSRRWPAPLSAITAKASCACRTPTRSRISTRRSIASTWPCARSTGNRLTVEVQWLFDSLLPGGYNVVRKSQTREG